jgi:hypothetical protein
MKKDDIVAITTGQYSDFQIAGTYLCLKDFDPAEVTNKWLSENPVQAARFKADFAAFMAWLVEQEFLQKTTVELWHIGAYDCFGEYPDLKTQTGPDCSERQELDIKADSV